MFSLSTFSKAQVEFQIRSFTASVVLMWAHLKHTFLGSWPFDRRRGWGELRFVIIGLLKYTIPQFPLRHAHWIFRWVFRLCGIVSFCAQAVVACLPKRSKALFGTSIKPPSLAMRWPVTSNILLWGKQHKIVVLVCRDAINQQISQQQINSWQKSRGTINLWVLSSQLIIVYTTAGNDQNYNKYMLPRFCKFIANSVSNQYLRPTMDAQTYLFTLWIVAGLKVLWLHTIGINACQRLELDLYVLNQIDNLLQFEFRNYFRLQARHIPHRTNCWMIEI